MTTVNYETDIVAWANEQAWLVRNKKFDLLDFEHIAEEIEDVGKSEQRELASRIAVLLCHLLKWRFQPTHQGASWQATIKTQRERVKRRLNQTPSLKKCLQDSEWLADAWDDARDIAAKETGIPFEKFPEKCIWAIEEILSDCWFPQSFVIN
ncbi:MAG: DUF29 domain-containing protein [Desulfamplus sp.]|nr:DUF29 domain-containing protein [Desulfamplus sp.]